jgi:hypothetical protein
MAAIIIRGNARPTWLTGLASVRATGCGMAQRAMACAAAAVMACAIGAALVQLADQILSFPAPIAVTGLTVMAAAVLTSLHRHLRARARPGYGPANPPGQR